MGGLLAMWILGGQARYVFGTQAKDMVGTLVRTIGLVRAKLNNHQPG